MKIPEASGEGSHYPPHPFCHLAYSTHPILHPLTSYLHFGLLWEHSIHPIPNVLVPANQTNIVFLHIIDSTLLILLQYLKSITFILYLGQILVQISACHICIAARPQ